MLHEQRRRVRRVEGQLATQHLVRDDAERVQVAPAVDVAVARGLLRAHERRRADRDAGGREPGAAVADRTCDAEVRDHRAIARGVEQDVVGLDVAMHHAVLMRVGERVADLPEDAPHLGRIECAAIVNALRQRVAVDERHHEEDEAVLLVDAVDRDDARVRELRRRLRLAKESRTDLGAERELGRQELDRDRALETAILRAIHDPHAAAADLPIELIRGIEHALDVRAQLGVRLRDLRFFHFAGYGSRRNGEHSTAPYKDTRQGGLA